ncbi:MAG: hypothetical protein QOE08_1439, partial [Thermoleophilaceae bacterium]|nr:hypothetical protein [Thermoleophilaceae bacterium]
MDTNNHIDDHRPLLLEVADFRHTSFGTERVLLRVDGRYLDRPGRRILEATLFVDDGLSIHRHAPLPEPDGDGGLEDWLWRAAFAVPASYLADERTTFALEAEPGAMLELPFPLAAALPAATTARPISGRAAHTARRYAAAVAVLVTVAVSPGGLPAAARTDVIKVTKADGSVVYVTGDGRELPQLPEDGVITGSQVAPPPAPQPPPPQQPVAPPAAKPAPAPAPAPAPVKKKPKRSVPTMLGDDSRAAQLTEGVLERRTTPRKNGRNASAANRPLKPRHVGGRPAVTPPAPHLTNDSRGPAGGRRHAGAVSNDTAPQQAAPTQATELVSLPQIVTQQVGDENFVRVERPVTGPRPASPTPPRRRRPAAAPVNEGAKSLSPLVALTDGSAAQLHTHTPSATPLSPLSDAGPKPSDWKTAPAVDAPAAAGGDAQAPSGGKKHKAPKAEHKPRAKRKKPRAQNGGARVVKPATPLRHSDGSPTRQNPSFFDALPGPSVQGVPNFVIRKFQVPLFLLPIYQAAGIQYGIRWEVLAAINEIETDYGRNLNVSSAGALGWMQFMPATWKTYGTDANKDGKRDPFNPVDAIFAAARYLKAADGDKDIRKAIFSYNHADWYVDSVLMRARLIAGVPGDVVGSLTGLTEGRFPVAARARYADDLSEKNATKKVKSGQNAANVVSSNDQRRSIDVFAREESPVVAVNDGVVKAVGRSKKRGLYLVLQDVYGNRYTYSGLGSVSDLYPVPRGDVSAKNSDQSV